MAQDDARFLVPGNDRSPFHLTGGTWSQGQCLKARNQGSPETASCQSGARLTRRPYSPISQPPPSCWSEYLPGKPVAEEDFLKQPPPQAFPFSVDSNLHQGPLPNPFLLPPALSPEWAYRTLPPAFLGHPKIFIRKVQDLRRYTAACVHPPTHTHTQKQCLIRILGTRQGSRWGIFI